MDDGVLHITLISATIHPEANFSFELRDTYATIRCGKEQRCTKTAQDEGKIPIWNETFAFNIHGQDTSKDIVVQVFGVGSDIDELLGVSRIPMRAVVGKTEGMLCTLSSPSKGETGKLKSAWRWTPASEDLLNLNTPSLVTTPKSKETSTFDSITDSMGKLAVKESSKESPSAPPYPETPYSKIGHAGYAPQVYGGTSIESYPLSNETHVIPGYPGSKESLHREEKEDPYVYGSYTSLRNSSETSFSPAPKIIASLVDTYPPYASSASSTEPAGFSPGRQALAPTYATRGIGDISDKGKGHDNYEAPYAYPPPPTHGGGYPPSYPAAEGSGYPPVYPPAEYPPPYSQPPSLDEQGGTLTKGNKMHGGGGYPPYQSGGYPPMYGHLPSGYPPGSAYPPTGGYPPAPQGYPPVPHGYPPPQPHAYPPGSSYPAGYPPYGYPGHGAYRSSAPYSVGHGYGPGYAAGAYVGHSSGKKHYKHHKLPKHSMHHGGYHGFVDPHYIGTWGASPQT